MDDKYFSKERISIVIMTGDKLRHKYFVNQLEKEFDVLGVLHEKHKPLPMSDVFGDEDVILKHSTSRDKKEELYFGRYSDFKISNDKILEVDSGMANSPEAVSWVKALNPDYLILYGTGIIRESLLEYFQDKVINMHLGLSPYYRGAATNFWPFVLREPECVGATVHLAVLKVDAGPIIGQIRPAMKLSDDSHDIGCNTIIAGTGLMKRCIIEYREGRVSPIAQTHGGKLFKIKDFNGDAVKKMLENFNTGMIGEYLQEKNSRDNKYPIINL